MSQKSLPAHRDYPDAEPSDDKDLEQSYDGPDQGYDAIDAGPDLDADADGGDQVDAETGFPAPDVFPAMPADVFPPTLFDDLLVVKPPKSAPGHGNS